MTEKLQNINCPALLCSDKFIITEVNEIFEREYPGLDIINNSFESVFVTEKSRKEIVEKIGTGPVLEKISNTKLNISGYFKFEIIKQLSSGELIIKADRLYLNSDQKVLVEKEFVRLANYLPIPLIVTGFNKSIFINHEARLILTRIFGSVDNFKLQYMEYSGLYREIIEKNNLNRRYKTARDTGTNTRSYLTKINPPESNPFTLLININIISDFSTGERIGFITTFENITEAMTLNREVHYLMENVSGIIEAYSKDRISYLLAYGEEETARHVIEVRILSEMIADALMKDNSIPDKRNTEYAKVTPLYRQIIGLSALLHDFGKADPRIHSLIHEPRVLTYEEYETVKTHTTLGANLIGYDNEILKMCRLVALYHHERWDGSGYPEGLKEYAIPLSARIVAFADMYSALKNERSYKEAINKELDLLEQMKMCESYFDPVIFKIGVSLIPEMEKNSLQIDVDYLNMEMGSEDIIKLFTDVFVSIMNKQRPS